MEHDATSNKTKAVSERFRCVMYFATIACMMTCVVFQLCVFIRFEQSFLAMNKRLDSLESKLVATATPEHEQGESINDGSGDRKKTLSREKRGVASLSVIQRLQNRVMRLEDRLLNCSSRSMASEDWRRGIFLRGRDGRDGRPGPPGIPGSSGPQGKSGPQGLSGPQGQSGPPGPPGPPGHGRDGRDGREGLLGPRGLPGPKGDVGKIGSAGPNGPPGRQGVKGPEGKGLSGVKFVHWGRRNCSGDASMVYSGVVGSGHYTHPGGGSNYICLPNTPIYGSYISGWNGWGAIYGTEYQTSGFKGFKNNIHNHEAPCAVCYVKTRGSQLMIPAKNACPSGWTREYHGYLMTAHYSHKHSSEFVCVDVNAEVVPGTQRDVDGALLYVVEGECTALPCQPYVEGRELTCAVCTK